jgi:hypothetical protein
MSLSHFQGLANIARENIADRQARRELERQAEHIARIAEFRNLFARSFGEGVMDRLLIVPYLVDSVPTGIIDIEGRIEIVVRPRTYDWVLWRSDVNDMLGICYGQSVAPVRPTEEILAERADELTLAIAKLLEI